MYNNIQKHSLAIWRPHLVALSGNINERILFNLINDNIVMLKDIIMYQLSKNIDKKRKKYLLSQPLSVELWEGPRWPVHKLGWASEFAVFRKMQVKISQSIWCVQLWSRCPKKGDLNSDTCLCQFWRQSYALIEKKAWMGFFPYD